MSEFVLNKAQRLTFDSSSPNGILLFREVSKLIVSYGSRILSLPNAADIYAFKYKGIWISLTILSRGENISFYSIKFVIDLQILNIAQQDNLESYINFAKLFVYINV